MKRKQKTKSSWLFSSQGVVFLFVSNLSLALILGVLFVGSAVGQISITKTNFLKSRIIFDENFENKNNNQDGSLFRIVKLNLTSDGQNSALITKIYPGYTMSFDVAVVSSMNEKQPIFVYSILDTKGEEVYHFSEQRNVGNGNVFTKKVTLPDDLPLGKYKLRVEAIVGDTSTIQEQNFYVEESPIAGLQSNMKQKSVSLISKIGLILTCLFFVLTLITFFVVIRHQKHVKGMEGT
jgi:hypothetical protein